MTTTEASRDSVQKIGDIMHRNMRQIKVSWSIFDRSLSLSDMKSLFHSQQKYTIAIFSLRS